MDTTARIRAFLRENFFVVDAIDDTLSLLDHGIIDSAGILQVIAFVETEFRIEILHEELVPENLDSIARLSAFIDGKLSAQRCEARQAS